MKVFFTERPTFPNSTREITFQELIQRYKNLEYQVYPIEDIILEYVDNDGNLYFTTRERE